MECKPECCQQHFVPVNPLVAAIEMAEAQPCLLWLLRTVKGNRFDGLRVELGPEILPQSPERTVCRNYEPAR